MELISTTTEPARAPSKTPPGPRMACSTSGPSGSMVTTISARLAASLDNAPSCARQNQFRDGTWHNVVDYEVIPSF